MKSVTHRRVRNSTTHMAAAATVAGRNRTTEMNGFFFLPSGVLSERTSVIELTPVLLLLLLRMDG